MLFFATLSQQIFNMRNLNNYNTCCFVMYQFFISPKMAKLLLMWTAGSIAVLSVLCAIFENSSQTVMLDSQSVKEVTLETQKATN